MPKVLIAPAPLAEIQSDFYKALKEAGFDLVYPQRKSQMNEDELLEQLKGISATVAGSEPYTRQGAVGPSAAQGDRPGRRRL